MIDRLIVLVFVLFPIFFGIFAVAWAYYNNKFVNTHPDREWIAIRNAITSKIAFVKKGVEYRMPWWKVDTVVRLNKEEMSTPPPGHKANTKCGGEIIVEARYNVLTGRSFNIDSGQLDRGPNEVLNENVLLAITKTKFEDRTQYVADVISTTIDYVIGQYTFDELVTLAEDGEGNIADIAVPRTALTAGENGARYTLTSTPIKNRSDFLVALALYIQHEANFRLRDVGFNVDEVELSHLAAANPKVQQDLDRSQQLRSRRRAMKQYAGLDLSDRELLANIEDLPQVSTAEAEMEKAKAYAIIGNGIANGLTALAKGLKDAFSPSK